MKRHLPAIILLLCILLFVFRSSLFVKNGAYKISAANRSLLSQMGSESIKSMDVPVASMVLYNDSVIGVGYNTVNRDSNIAGHAEINALSAVVKKIGFAKFNSIKDSMTLITTYEPCGMCKGAILEYEIRNLVFLKKKSLWHWIKTDWKDFKYELRKKQIKDKGALQDSLFRLYPGYKS
ncbi:MAG: nucleoside deaminase [Bacteroidota bacterium]